MNCYGHSLNLAVCDTVKNANFFRTFDVFFEIGKLIELSPKRDALFQKLKQEIAPDSPGFRVLCPTRWTVKAKSLLSVLHNYTVLQELWECCLTSNLNPELKSRNNRSICSNGERIMKKVDNLSKTLQNSTISAIEDHKVAELTIVTMEMIRNEENFDLFREFALKKASLFNMEEPTFPGKKIVPLRFETRSEYILHHQQRNTIVSITTKYWILLLIQFDHDLSKLGLKKCKILQNLLLNAINGKNDFVGVTAFYDDEIDPPALKFNLR